MSATAATQVRRAVTKVRRVIAIELLCGVEATRYLQEELSLGRGTEAARQLCREVVSPLDGDRPLHEDIDRTAGLVASGKLDSALQEAGVDIE